MPQLTVPITSLGPIFLVGVGVSQARRKALQLLDKESPPVQPANALLDTGAGGTMVDSTIIKNLGLTPRGRTQIITPSTGPGGVYLYVYDVSIWLLGSQPADVLETSTQVIRTDLKHQGFEVLLGRDILADCFVIYHGAAKTCTLSF